MEKILEVKNVFKRFGTIQALKNVSFHLIKSEALGLIGDNGAGKSTMIKILAGVYEADSGEIYYEGRKVHFSSPLEARNAGVEAVHQDPTLAMDLDIVRNVFLGREVTSRFNLLDFRQMRNEAIKALTSFNLSIPMDQKASTLSGGQQQGVELARAVYSKAKVILLDEPTRALGVQGVKQVHKYMRGLRKKGIACIYISHALHHVYDNVDRFIVLSRGRKIKDIKKENIQIGELVGLMSKRK